MVTLKPKLPQAVRITIINGKAANVCIAARFEKASISTLGKVHTACSPTQMPVPNVWYAEKYVITGTKMVWILGTVTANVKDADAKYTSWLPMMNGGTISVIFTRLKVIASDVDAGFNTGVHIYNRYPFSV
ncbi:MAG: hypothetical protein J5379_00490 [Clostridiales bacterium]|nr:hypothetical protein [Clostridiales bacterium]